MERLECKCGGTLRRYDHQYICENCDSVYLITADDKGELFAYQPVEKKHITTGQMAPKAATISVNKVVVRQIRLDEDIDSQVLRESMDLDRHSRLGLIEGYLSTRDWEKVDEHVNALLLENSSCAEARWYGWMSEKRASNDTQMLSKLSGFSQADGVRLDQILACASPALVQRIVHLFFDGAFTNDAMRFHTLAVILPYARNPLICSGETFSQKVRSTFDRVIDAGYEQSFNFLLENTLDSRDVDTYISYMTRFADRCEPRLARVYYERVLAVDPGNVDVHRKLVWADIQCDIPCETTVSHVERLIRYSNAVDQQVAAIIHRLSQDAQTTANKSDILWQLLSYHSTAPEGLKAQLLAYGHLLLESRLWLRARDYFNLVLSFDVRCGDAYWGLCLVQMQARNAQDAINKTEPIISFSTYDKALAVYTAAGDIQMVNYLRELSQRQKGKKEGKKAALLGSLLAGAAVLVVLTLVVAIFAVVKLFQARKYSANNIEITLVNQEAVQSPVSEFDIRIRNGCTAYLDKIEMTFYFYDSKNNLITSTGVSSFCSMIHKDEKTWNITLHQDAANDLYYYSFDELKITVAINKLYFFTYNHTEDLGEGKERVLKKAERSLGWADSKTAQKLQDAFEILDATHINDSDYQEQAMEFGYALDEIWNDVVRDRVHLQTMYEKAEQYRDDRQYDKAFYVFSLLATVEYEDSEQQAAQCAMAASR